MEALVAQFKILVGQFFGRVDRQGSVDEVGKLIVAQIDRKTELLVGLVDLGGNVLRNERLDLGRIDVGDDTLLFRCLLLLSRLFFVGLGV